jgi:hypothetical protein
MENNTQKESGVRLSFFSLFKERNYKIEIPIIQRDYAQGRKANSDIRNDFLTVLKTYLDEAKPNRDLDFIYGSLINGDGIIRFIPLDGQQRLTTLFLLHWYIASKEGKQEQFRKDFADASEYNQWKSKFTYETRTSAREFCDAMVSSNIDLYNLLNSDENKKNGLSKTIKNQQWYFLSWKNDPTIMGMLVMLDAIHEKFKDEEKQYYDLLTDLENPIITFQFLKIDEFGLSDDLYIKMNSRGKPLTSFENFKAKFEQQLKNEEINKTEYLLTSHGKKVKLQEYFSHKIDTEWAHMFWAYLKEELEKKDDELDDERFLSVDETIMNFLKTYAVNYIAGKADSEKNLKELIKTSSKELSFNQFSQYRCFENTSILNLIKLLDILQNKDKKAKQFIPQFYYYDENSLEKFLKPESRTAEYVERILFHAYCEYLIKWSVNDNFGDFEGLKNWMRVVHNLTENTAPYNNEKEFSNSIIGINEIINDSNQILDYLINNKPINGFDQIQVKEERIKATLIKKDSEWLNLIHKAEQHNYFKGQIGFLLRLCGAEDRYNEAGNCNWSEVENLKIKKDFRGYYQKSCLVFDGNGLKKELSRGGNFIWERAMLTIGDYLIDEGRNRSFLIARDRDISWKRFLKGDKSTSHPKYIKAILDAINTKDVIGSLNNLINTFKGDRWRKAFIETPQLFNDLGAKRYVRPNSDHGFVLLKGERMTGAHGELFSRKFYFDYKPISPFTNLGYYNSMGADENNPPCCYFDKWDDKSYSIKVCYFNGEYEIRFYNKEPEGIEPDMEKILLSKNMLMSSKYNDISFLKSVQLESDTVDFLNELCAELQKI